MTDGLNLWATAQAGTKSALPVATEQLSDLQLGVTTAVTYNCFGDNPATEDSGSGSRAFTRSPLSPECLKDSIQKVNPENILERNPGAFRSICSKFTVCHLASGGGK